MENIAILLDLLLRAAGQLQQYATLINKARSENRDVSRAELDALFADDDAARARLQALIEERR